ncbi:hypothetical protein N9X87_00130 [bacterium]|nr:hypothetical protein [bacterium]
MRSELLIVICWFPVFPDFFFYALNLVRDISKHFMEFWVCGNSIPIPQDLAGLTPVKPMPSTHAIRLSAVNNAHPVCPDAAVVGADFRLGFSFILE